jgi:hypothetical protein
MSEHTPGPWRAYVSDDRTLWAISAGDDFVIYPGNEIVDAQTWDEAFGACGSTTEGRSEANAHLVAAAPEMLEALRRADELLGKMTTDDVLVSLDIQNARVVVGAAITKATQP